MTNKVIFHTDGLVPLDAFTTFGVNVKPNSKSPFGFFGTGLKYAVAVILREGGQFQLFRDGVEYEFYLSDKDFRGKMFQQVRMRKRKWGMSRWMKSTPLPFTTELGKTWKLWQAYRELESNTRDEGGFTDLYDSGDEYKPHGSGTTEIVITCDRFLECTEHTWETIDKRSVSTRVFLEPDHMNVVHDSPLCTVYEGGSKHLYYQGIRVYDLRNPSRYTYDFKPGQVILSEDRSAKNIWDLQWKLAHEIQSLQDHDLLADMLTGEDHLWYETDDLTFYSSGNRHFNAVARMLRDKGYIGRSGLGFASTYLVDEEPEEETFEIKLTADEWQTVIDTLYPNGEHYLADKIKEQLE